MIAVDNTELLPGESPELVLVPATPEERIKSIKLNSTAWKGRLDVDTYIARENHLLQQRLVNEGLTCWILVDRREPEGERTILSSCETYKKKAVRAYCGSLSDVPTYGIGSVFCRPEYRGKGYAKRMLQELCRKLDMWGMSPEQGSQPYFSVLFSDIGKNFYAQFGWKPFPSSHISLPPISKEQYDQSPGANLPKARTFGADDVRDCMCSDEVLQKERESLRAASNENPGVNKVAILPDFDHFTWHWAREEFYVEKLHADRAPPQIKGAGEDQARVYCAWTRNFGETPQDNTLYILRWVYDEPTTPEETEALAKAMAAILRRAQLEAHEWDMAKVDFWNPTPLLQKAVGLLDSPAELIHREKSSIASLRWTGATLGLGDEVEWVWNEKYAWC
ncbi:uncharacterized protein ACLA_074860 [Aspergillus clavatus NRRL 1]|uniref:GNAT family acetyltransferase, putative n=1 Tax=Aspergillus clavatus (strain ATCC 1007 / CBS 513.65 / DSM 816 / NCTC 3887 / NRRL 1 / QM 1276 / 107) TaxID=344612 RepID=A1C7S7_ASPCL|nr:GNAT family acetyltransferase, putative [Aspergillus clavatus NRRL 1]EAW14448.1 GNAT family acetyltransferase, putative [Aspergillus clavatus NRRL 1]